MRRLCLIIDLSFVLFFALHAMMSPSSLAAHPAPPILAQQSGKPFSPHVGAAMTVLATLDQAQVLPPEGTKAADRIIQSVIQLQSLFTTSTNPAIQTFLYRAVARRAEEQATQVLAHFRSSGWTPEVLEALAHATQAAPPDELQSLAAGLGSVNLSVEDFTRFMQLVRDSEQALVSTGHNFHKVFHSQRKLMPGAAH